MWDTFAGHCSGTTVNDTLVTVAQYFMGHSCVILFQETLFGHSGTTVRYDILKVHIIEPSTHRHSCVTLLRDALPGHSCKTLRKDILATLVWVTLVCHSKRIVVGPSSETHSCVCHSWVTLLSATFDLQHGLLHKAKQLQYYGGQRKQGNLYDVSTLELVPRNLYLWLHVFVITCF